MEVIIDIETDGIDDPKNIWVIVCREIASGDTHVFREPTSRPEESERFKRYLEGVSLWIGHHIIKYDIPIINNLLGTNIPLDSGIVDTLVVSRLIYQARPGGHSLENWGSILSFPKNLFSDFNKYSTELEDRCVKDTELNLLVYNFLLKYIKSAAWKTSIETEHYTEYLTYILNKNGFTFNLEKAAEYKKELETELNSIREKLEKAFPPRSKFIKEILPRETKKGTLHASQFKWHESIDLTPFTPGNPFSLFTFDTFNPSSPKQAIERLWEFGWKPIEKTDAHKDAIKAKQRRRTKNKEEDDRLDHFAVYGWKLSDTNLETLPADAPESARMLSHWLKVRSRSSTLQTWFDAYQPNDGRIHGRFMGIGAWTHRMSHNSPNMANIPRETDKFGKEAYYGKEFRELWTASPGKKLIGVDAASIQLRVLAHYMNDPAFTKAVISGSSKDGTDPHSLNKKALGDICKGRDPAKRFIYAWLLGAGVDMVAHILDCSRDQAQIAVNNFIEFYPGLKALKEEQIPNDARLGYFKGFDGRYVSVVSEHLVLAGYLQNGESCIMKTAAKIWYPRLVKEKIPFKFINFVHDEWQTEVDDDDDLCDYVGGIQADAIVKAGEILNLNCPQAGEIKKGYNWYQTH